MSSASTSSPRQHTPAPGSADHSVGPERTCPIHVLYVCIHVHMFISVHTVYAEIFVGEIFCGLNFHGIKFSWLKPSLLDGKMAAEFRKKLCVHGYHVYNI